MQFLIKTLSILTIVVFTKGDYQSYARFNPGPQSNNYMLSQSQPYRQQPYSNGVYPPSGQPQNLPLRQYGPPSPTEIPPIDYQLPSLQTNFLTPNLPFLDFFQARPTEWVLTRDTESLDSRYQNRPTPERLILEADQQVPTFVAPKKRFQDAEPWNQAPKTSNSKNNIFNPQFQTPGRFEGNNFNKSFANLFTPAVAPLQVDTVTHFGNKDDRQRIF